MSHAGRQQPRRLLLALDALNYGAAPIEAAAALAALLGAQLDVIFVEDDELHAAAALPIMQEISSASARERGFSALELETALRAINREAEARFHSTVGDRSIKGSFRTTRGTRREALGAASAGTDLLLVPAARGILGFRVISVPLTRICAICSATPAGIRTLELAGRLASRSGRALELVCVGDPDQGALAEVQATVSALMRRDYPASTPLIELLDAVAKGPGTTLLIARDLATAADGHALLAQLDSLRCEVLLVG